jgi:hypothetical protein
MAKKDETPRVPQEGSGQEISEAQAAMEAEKALFNYGCVMTARGLNKDELSILMRTRNAQTDAQLSDGKVDELTESAFMFALKDDSNVDLPTITAVKRQLAPLLDEIYDSLQSDATLFRHGEGLVSIRDGAISHYTTDTVVTLLSRRANYVDMKRAGMFPPIRAASAVLYASRGSEGDRIRPLERIVNVPTLREDGTVFDSPGYDVMTGIYYHPVGNPVRISPRPTKKDASKAAGWLLGMLSDFPFESESDLTNYVGLLLTFVVRELCECVPLALIDAPSAGTGKSLLAKIAAITATGALPEFGILPGEETEARKLFTSKLQESPPILVFDNADGVIGSSALAALITSDVWQDRLLGRNRILHLPMRSVLIVTGNNIRLGGDIPRRCYRVRIDANAARPWTRGGFRHRLPDYATENRGKIITCLLTMARAWIVAGRPESGNTTLGSFESWCQTVGGILEYAGLNGVLDNLQEMYRDTADGDDDAEQWTVWMDAIHAHFGENAFTVKQLAEAMSDFNAVKLQDDAPYSLGEIGQSSDRAWLTRLGKALHSRKGQVFRLGESSIKLRQGIADPRSGKKHYWLDEK